MTTTVESAVSLFGERTKGKLANVGASGQPEDQLRSPFESLLRDMSALTALAGAVEAVGESSVASLKTRPDYAVTVKNALVGFVELKACGKGADPPAPCGNPYAVRLACARPHHEPQSGPRRTRS